MVDIGALFGDENEDYRNKAKVSYLQTQFVTFAVGRGDREVLHEGRSDRVAEGRALA